VPDNEVDSTDSNDEIDDRAVIADLEQLYLQEEREYWKRREYVQKIFWMNSNFNSLYSLLFDVVTEYQSGEDRSEKLALMQFIMGSLMAFGNSIKCLLRGQSTDGHSHIRKAVEFALFALNIFEYNGTAKKWLDCGNSKADWKDYRDSFKIMTMLNPNTYLTLNDHEKEVLDGLLQAYARCCVPLHATHLSITSKLKLLSSTSGYGAEFGYVDNLSSDEVRKEFLWILEVHSLICEIYSCLVQRIVDFYPEEAAGSLKTAANSLLKDAYKDMKLKTWRESKIEHFWDDEIMTSKRLKNLQPWVKPQKPTEMGSGDA